MSASVSSQDALSIDRAVKLEFPMAEGNLYQIQDSADLGSWSDSGPAVVGENCMETVMQSIQNADRKFWRVIPGSASNVLDFGEARSLSSTNFISFENVLWRGKHWLIDYRIGNVLHQDEMKELNTVQIPTASITIDGDPADWTGVPTVYTDPQHDQNSPDGHQGTDIKEYRIARDATYIYMAFWLHDANPPEDGTMYFTEFQQYFRQMHTPGDTFVVAMYASGSARWQVTTGHREDQGPGVTFGQTFVGVGTKFIEYKIPIAKVEYDGGGVLPKRGIQTRFLRTYAHYVHNGNAADPLSTFDGASLDADTKALIVDFN